MFDIQSLILGLTILLNLFLAGFVIAKGLRNKTHWFFGAFVLFIVFWTLSVLLFRSSKEVGTAILQLRFAYVTAGFIGVTFFAFCLSYIKRKLPRILWFLIIFIVVLMSILLLQPWFLIRSIVQYPWGKAVIEAPLHHALFSFYFIIFFFGALAIIGNQYRKAVYAGRVRLGFIFWGMLLAGSFGTFFDLILPSPWFNEWRFIWLGPIFTLIFVLCVTIAITKHRFLNIRVIVAEFFTITLLLITSIEIFLSRHLIELLVRSIVFCLLLLFGVFCIRSVYKEIRQREEIQALTKGLEKKNRDLAKAYEELRKILYKDVYKPLQE